MKLANNIQFRVFSNPHEDRELLKKTLLSLAGFEGFSQEQIEEEKISYKEINAKGFSQKIIVIMELRIEKERHTNKFLKNLSSAFSQEQKHLLIEQVNRLDDNMNFYIRLSKEDLIDGKYVLTDGGDCFHITISIEAHPKRTDVAHKIVKQIFGL